MAYPFHAAPTLGEFLARTIREFGCTLESATRDAMGPRGPTQIRYLARGPGSFVVLPSTLSDSDVLTPTVLRHFCDRLGIPAGSFGLTLDSE